MNLDRFKIMLVGCHTAELGRTLKRKVASPNAVTEAALNVIENKANDFPPLMGDAVKAACKRSRELSGA